jgi:hypothetical protein
MVARTIRSTVMEVPHMSDERRLERAEQAREILPWADPYIAGLLEKLRASESASPYSAPRWDRWQLGRELSPRNEQPPPLFDPHPELDLPRRMPAP